jgi:Uma2 family endonuclease
MSRAQPVHRYTVAEYYEREYRADHKSDYYNGEIFAMAGGTARHSKLTMNLGAEFHGRLKGRTCEIYESNLRIKIKSNGLRTYPDGSVFCEPLVRDEEDKYRETYVNPAVIFEVLSKSTEAYDRGLKAWSYRNIESLKAYVLVSQAIPRIEIQERQPNGGWAIRDVDGIDAMLSLPCIGVEIPLSDIYLRVDFSIPDEDADQISEP